MFYNPDNQNYAYDPDKAKAALEAAGVSGLSLKLLIASGDAVHEQIAVLLKDQLAKVGVDVQIEKQEPGQAWESTVAGDYDISINYWTNDIIDPDQKASFCVHWDPDNQSYYTNYKSQEVSDLVLAGRVELDPAKRRDIYYKIQQVAKDDVHWIDLYYSPFRNASRANVKNLLQNPMGKFTLEDVVIE
jgi:peptide/nickel transport system substrate-binding protein